MSVSASGLASPGALKQGFNYNTAAPGPRVGKAGMPLAIPGTMPSPASAAVAMPYFGKDDAFPLETLLEGVTLNKGGLVAVGGGASLRNLLSTGISQLGEWIAQPVELTGGNGMGLTIEPLTSEDKLALANKTRNIANVARTMVALNNTSMIASLKKALTPFETNMAITQWLSPEITSLPETNSNESPDEIMQRVLAAAKKPKGFTDDQDNALKAQVMANLSAALEALDKLAPQGVKKEFDIVG